MFLPLLSWVGILKGCIFECKIESILEGIIMIMLYYIYSILYESYDKVLWLSG